MSRVEAQRGLCECGCGQPTPIAKKPNKTYGHVKGEPVRFLLGHGVRQPAARKKIAAAQASRVIQPGERFGRLTVKADTGRRSGAGHRLLLCECECGEMSEVFAGNLRRKDGTRSCGCLIKEAAARRKRPADVRFYRHVGEPTELGCHPWTGGVYATGYPQFEGRVAHRFAYQIVHGSIPDGHHIHHRCRNRLCVNPEHLEALTPTQHNRLHAELSK